MAAKYSAHYGNTKKTPQTQPIPGRESEMVENNAGGFVFEADAWKKLQRFLILGSEGGSYYADERTLTIECAQNVMRLIQLNGVEVVNVIHAVSINGKAYKQDPTMFALALAWAHGGLATRERIAECFNEIMRIGTHLFMFLNYVKDMTGWGKSLRRLIQNWYITKSPAQLAFQVTKYKQRGGMSHRDALRLSHPKNCAPEVNAVLRWVVAGKAGLGERTVIRYHDNVPAPVTYPDMSGLLPEYLVAVERACETEDVNELVGLIREHRLPREVIPTKWLNSVPVWDALLDAMPITALIRTLGKLGSLGIIRPMAARTGEVVDKLTNKDVIAKSRVHPIQILAALLTYSSGKGVKGSLSWEVNQAIADALDKAFYLSFGNVVASNERILYAVDVSGSMGWSTIAGVPGLTPAVAAAAMALICAYTEPNHHIMAFSDALVPVNVSKSMRLDTVCSKFSELAAGGTNCALPMLWALENKVSVDAFVILTDSETWCGGIHPQQALVEYRKTTGIQAKLAVVAMMANNFSIADPSDAGMMDFVGFSTDTPSVLSDFIRGDV